MSSPWEIGRAGNWWEYKIPPVVASCFAAAAVYGVTAGPASWRTMLILLIGAFAGSYGHIVNDVFDVDADRAAGKPNQMAGFSPVIRFVLCAGCVVLGFLPAVLAGFTTFSLWLLTVEYLLPTVYSAPPLRLKVRGWWGIVADALGAHAIPALFVLSAFAPPGIDWVRGWFAALVGVWSLFFGLKGICIHEFADREADRQAGVTTWATGTDERAARRTIAWLYWVELAAFACLFVALLPFAPVLGAAGAIYAGVLIIKVTRGWSFYGRGASEAARVQRWQFTGPFYECYFPMAMTVAMACRDPRLVWAPALLPLVFRGNFRDRWNELQEAAKYVWMRLRRVAGR